MPKKGGVNPAKDRNWKAYAAVCLDRLCFIQDSVVSSIRLENPHSLSYQAKTLVEITKHFGVIQVHNGACGVVVKVLTDKR